MANGMTIDNINKYFQDIYTILPNKGEFSGDFTMPVGDIRNLSDEQLIDLLKQGERFFGHPMGERTNPQMDAELEQALLNLASERGAQTEQLYYKDTPYLDTFIPSREGDPLSGSDPDFSKFLAVARAQEGGVNIPGFDENYAELRDTNYPFEVLASVPEFAHSLIDDLIAQNEQEGISTEETANFQNLIDLIAAQR
tara:strand:+ start:1519 stop:2109 length:591 start_codon:yes stop_codon:yes gene_type:complete